MFAALPIFSGGCTVSKVVFEVWVRERASLRVAGGGAMLREGLELIERKSREEEKLRFGFERMGE